MTGKTGHVLVTGAPGFIGRRVVARLLGRGFSVTSLSLPGEACLPEWNGAVVMRHGDLGDPSATTELVESFDLVIHLAAPVGVAGAYAEQWRAMVDGTRNIALLAARRRARLVVVSSIAVYGDRLQSQRCDEETPFGAWQGAYGRAKQGQEAVAREQAAEHQLALTIVRPANVFGLGGASAWGDRLLDAIRETGGAVIGDGAANDAALTHVENLADAIVLAATHPRAVGRTYNVCDGCGVSWRRFLDDMASLVGRPPPPSYPLDEVVALAKGNEDPSNLLAPRVAALPFLEALNLVGYSLRVDASRIRQELGWAPSVSYEAALRKMRESLAGSMP